MRLAEYIQSRLVPSDHVALYYLAQAGFCLKTSRGTVAMIDPYLSDFCYLKYGFKRMIPAPLAASDLEPDLILHTHAHADHLDPVALGTFAANGRTCMVGACDCKASYVQAGLATTRYEVLKPGQSTAHEDLQIRAVYADHGALAPDAVGFVVHIDKMCIYFSGDTGFQPDDIAAALAQPIDLMIVPINGAYGNLDSRQACELAETVRPKLLIPCHFWMFVEHGGDPAGFLRDAKNLSPGIRTVLMAPGQELVYSMGQTMVETCYADISQMKEVP